MSYVKAVDVLPDEILELIQNYVDGEYIIFQEKKTIKRVGERILTIEKK